MGAPASGNRTKVPGVNINHISGGRIPESWTNYDALETMQQIGAIPVPDDRGTLKTDTP